jgi:hypothetical protein
MAVNITLSPKLGPGLSVEAARFLHHLSVRTPASASDSSFTGS